MKAETSSSGAITRVNWRTILQWVSIVVAGEIALHSLFVKEPVVTIAGAALWLGGCLWTRRGASEGQCSSPYWLHGKSSQRCFSQRNLRRERPYRAGSWQFTSSRW